MRSIKQVLATILAVVAFATTASAYTVTIADTYIGGDPAGSSWDGKDVVGDSSIFGIDSMNILFNNGNLSSVSIFTNYVKDNTNLGAYETRLGDLFISTNGYINPGVYDINTTGEQWEYALVFNETYAHSKDITLAEAQAGGSLALYRVTNSNIILSHAAPNYIYRNYQEVMINTAFTNDLISSNVGNWSVSGNELKFALTTLPTFLDVSDYGFRWGMSCGNDIIEGGATAPVPEPGTMMLLGVGMLGLAIFGKRRMNKDS